MATKPLFCEACGRITEHIIDTADEDGGELALCTLCGRLSSPPAKSSEPAPSDRPCPCNSRTR